MMMSRMTPMHAGQPLTGVCNSSGGVLVQARLGNVYARCFCELQPSYWPGHLTSVICNPAWQHTHVSRAEQSDVQSGTELTFHGSNLQQPKLNSTHDCSHTECTSDRGMSASSGRLMLGQSATWGSPNR